MENKNINNTTNNLLKAMEMCRKTIGVQSDRISCMHDRVSIISKNIESKDEANNERFVKIELQLKHEKIISWLTILLVLILIAIQVFKG